MYFLPIAWDCTFEFISVEGIIMAVLNDLLYIRYVKSQEYGEIWLYYVKMKMK